MDTIGWNFFLEKNPQRGKEYIIAALKDQASKHQEHLEEQTRSRQEKDFW